MPGHATIEKSNCGNAFHFERHLPHPVEEVWHIHLDLLSDVLEGKLGAFYWPDQKWIEEHDKYAQLLG